MGNKLEEETGLIAGSMVIPATGPIFYQFHRVFCRHDLPESPLRPARPAVPDRPGRGRAGPDRGNRRGGEPAPQIPGTDSGRTEEAGERAQPSRPFRWLFFG